MSFDFFYKYRRGLIALFVLLTIGSAFLLPQVKFNFSFEQFFPQGDKDLEFFQNFVNEFETDDNFLLIALEHEDGVFDSTFLENVRAFSLECKALEEVRSVQALPLFRYPVMTPFGPNSVAALHWDDEERLLQDSIRLMSDERVRFNLLNKDGTATAVVLKTIDGMQIEASKSFMKAINSALEKHELDQYYMLGRAYFQTELSAMQFREIMVSTIISGFLISLIMIVLYKKPWSIFVALSSIGVGLVLFLGLLTLLDRELTIMAALYPVLMLIVGTSDVVHIMTKYFDELKKGFQRKAAILTTIKQIGLATLLTSLTTAAGFATLLSSRIGPIRDFGVNSAIGVVLAFIVVILFTCPMLTLFSKSQLVPEDVSKDKWPGWMLQFYEWTNRNRREVFIAFMAFLVLSAWGISMIHTNYAIEENLPRGQKITEDFQYFENEFAGFRPLEIAVFIGEDYEVYDYEVLRSIHELQEYILSKEEIQTAFSLSTLVKSINQMNNSNRSEAYVFPEREAYPKVRRLMNRTKMSGLDLLISKDRRKTRISSKIKDIGSENIGVLGDDIDGWIAANIDSSVVQFKQTGTGIILDKNSEFVRESLLSGLGIALLIVSVLMGLLFRRFKVLLLALIPNIIPLLFAAALLGYFNVALEAGISIVFAIIFGIAVDDTIHFLSKYKLAMDELKDREAALLVSYKEAGKAIVFTSIILFFGFLVLLFSSHPPSVTIGALISVTLLSALIADLTILPVLIRFFKI
ncbi:MAG: MMPL family transporter [Saprospiraceae bacterium]|nr:MMPL family transporter [Saprospiraceae bacterium]